MTRFLFLFPLFAFVVFADDIDNCIRLTQELDKLRQAESAAMIQWKEMRQLMEARLNAAQTALTEIQKTKDQHTAKLKETKDNIAKIHAETAQIQQRLAAIIPILDNCETQLLQLSVALPAPLLNKITDCINQFKTKRTSPADVPEKLKDILTAYHEIAAFDSGIHLAREVITGPDNIPREHEILYLGLSTAFAATPKSEYAGRAIFTKDGLSWQWDKAWLAPVRSAMDIASKSKPASLIPLPLQTKPTSQK